IKFRPDRDEDMSATGKLHDFLVDYELGFDAEGRIHAVHATYASRCGFSSDLSGPVTDRAPRPVFGSFLQLLDYAG
ncbi:molybdopterin cofactor-binding domain-containing protein, partial [Rhizobium leguminosarum]|uniref:molybdopterin cofactor-binding domain-containing protein n=1 Tax=Rhizobium leguminosarum TaxID=384 RepID=UPI003F954101